MPKWYWVKRLIFAFSIAGVVLFVAHLLRGHTAAEAVGSQHCGGVIAAVIFMAAGYIKYKRNPACMLPRSRKP